MTNKYNISEYIIEELNSYSPKSIIAINRYLKFISCKLVKDQIDVYTEKHHIIPKSISKKFYNDKNNIVSLTPREHFIAHYLLAKCFGGSQWAACNIIAQCDNPHQNRKAFNMFNSKLYEISKIKENEYKSAQMTILRANESEKIKISRIEKWKISSRKCDNCGAILRGHDSSILICAMCQKSELLCEKYGEDYISLTKEEKYKIRHKNSPRTINKNKRDSIYKKAVAIHRIMTILRKIKTIKAKEELDKKKSERIKIKEELNKNKIINQTRKLLLQTLRKIKRIKEEKDKIHISTHPKQNPKIKLTKNTKKEPVIYTKIPKIKKVCTLCNNPKKETVVYNKTLKPKKVCTLCSNPTKGTSGICAKCRTHDEMVVKYGEDYHLLTRKQKVLITLEKQSPEEKKERNKKISKAVSNSISNRTQEEKDYYSNLYKQTSLNYYNSPNYDANKKSMQVKDGISKSKKNKKNSI